MASHLSRTSTQCVTGFVTTHLRLPRQGKLDGNTSSKVFRRPIRVAGTKANLFGFVKQAFGPQQPSPTAGVQAVDAKDAQRRFGARVDQVNSLEEHMERLSLSQLREKASELRNDVLRHTQGFTPETVTQVFALVREVSFRTIGLRHFDVQVMAGLAILENSILEMATGEGKTLVSTLPVTIYGFLGRGAHVVTVNDYLARRDYELLKPVFEFLGVSVGLVVSTSSTEDRKQAYASDVTYVTNSELGFDYLRDHLAMKRSDQVLLRPFHFCLIDEADSILIDEARTPLLITKEGECDAAKIRVAAGLVNVLKRGVHYELDNKAQLVNLTDRGVSELEAALKVKDLFDPSNPWAPFIFNALKSKEFYSRDQDYIVDSGKVIIIDRFTGRALPGRRWGDGLHQSVEAKENVEISIGTQAIASTSYQAFFKLFPNLSGMTGTAISDFVEFSDIYRVGVIQIPTALPIARRDYPDVLFRSKQGKLNALVKEIHRAHTQKRPVLIGTTSISESDEISNLLSNEGLTYQVLNAKPENASKESQIISQAGQIGAITIATNMAGRGTDIELGGNAKYLTKMILVGPVRSYLETGKDADVSGSGIVSCFPKETVQSLIDELHALRTKDELLEVNAFLDEMRFSSEQSWLSPGCPSQLQDLSEMLLSFVEASISSQKREVLSLGGLYVMGTERHEARRIDNQLRGRAGRQGDPGSSRFFISFDDTLLQLFGGDQMKDLMSKFRVDDDTPIENDLVAGSVDRIQEQVEDYYRGIRRRLFEFDEVMNVQRVIVYRRRSTWLNCSDDELKDLVSEMCVKTGSDIVSSSGKKPVKERVGFLVTKLSAFFPGILLSELEAGNGLDRVAEVVMKQVNESVLAKFSDLDENRVGLAVEVARYLALVQLDSLWVNHIRTMDLLKDAVSFRNYGGERPLDAYRTEGDRLFSEMEAVCRRNTVYSFFQYRR
uniref:Protein translocase subunit SecA n=1 Tax=Compsopogon caeruleus TaxID=31354 RepID=A0A7S1TFT3_9RHOD|mmetsp:Transcript_5267/g.10776  ORF Transcript_5267/g.10776 Transcript_5267/m.10776 type:complete len:951 (+) Transcript_5267:161-3013(+)|eukprot:CAMPEP_0184682578 /NCGR_PEP_ID=MMETSP0312-20130426/7832_1 /TAXON_ID=31354 /ORGANISM="Compsopogon coeruleus, Strain SAG 36.94" /LENGTH=950 /DNA_ID=CAMNT_0027134337 /DNA_START=72 /DNA_END=2924 /DNA_ORIENTATION=-